MYIYIIVCVCMNFKMMAVLTHCVTSEGSCLLTLVRAAGPLCVTSALHLRLRLAAAQPSNLCVFMFQLYKTCLSRVCTAESCLSLRWGH